MTQPTVITGSSLVYETAANSGTTRTFSNVSIPAECNTFMALVVLSATELSAEWSDITFNGLGAVKLHQVDVSSGSTIKATMVAVFDTSDIGAVTGDIVATLSEPETFRALLGVVCTTGFVESFAGSNDRFSNLGRSTAWSGNYQNNIQVLMGGQDRDADLFSVTKGIEIYAEAPVGFPDPVVWAAYQDTNETDGQKIIEYSAAIEEVADICFLISSQKNPFVSNFGPVIRPIISHDVIS